MSENQSVLVKLLKSIFNLFEGFLSSLFALDNALAVRQSRWYTNTNV